MALSSGTKTSNVGRPRKSLGTFVLVCLIGYLMTIVIEGPLRYGLALAGAGALLYVRDLVAIGVVALLVADGLLVRRWLDPIPAVLLSLLGFHLVVALLSTVDPSQALFGFKIFLPMVFAASIFPLIRDRLETLTATMRFVLLLSLAGICVNWWLGSLPWEGLRYETGFGAVTSTQRWWTYGGQARLPGFTRSSFDAAIIVGLSGMWVLLTTRSALRALLVSIACLWAISLTTTKGMLIAFAVMAVWVFYRRFGSVRPGRGSWIYLAASIVALLVPALMLAYGMQGIFDPRDAPDAIRSLLDRFDDMWPRAIQLMESPASPLFGQGLGAIGAAQVFKGETAPVLNAGDNIFVYSYVTFGLLGVAYLFALAIHAYRRRLKQDPWNDFRSATLIMTFTYGMTTNVLESAFFLSFLGLVVGDALSSGMARRPPARLKSCRTPEMPAKADESSGGHHLRVFSHGSG